MSAQVSGVRPSQQPAPLIRRLGRIEATSHAKRVARANEANGR
jgi:hypothetical protein